ncbi:glutamate 5-kinase [Tatumella punctata]|uniref:Glutamate 5-kinase n=1 Tax=Tatumella punctata TaxID=399969 RepID=A0ABW1VSN5_9GAMM
MGIRNELQTEIAAAFDDADGLADTVNKFTASYIVAGEIDPVTEESTSQTISYSGRGVLSGYSLSRIDGVNILHGDLKLTALTNEVTDKPAEGHLISAPDLVKSSLQTYKVITVGTDAAGATYSIQLRRS